MVTRESFRRVGACSWELPESYDERMQAPARIYAGKVLFERAFGDRSVEQLVNVAMLPGLVKYAMALPDMHQGYGFPIGGVAAFDYDKGIISPGGVGYDINCGVRMLTSRMDYEEVAPHMDALATALHRHCPSGVGGSGAVNLSWDELNAVLEEGSGWALKSGYATAEDVTRTESDGCLPQAQAAAVPDRAKARGRGQLGSLGSGNHFLEVDVVDEVYDVGTAECYGLRVGQVVVQIHCGSRGLGHEVCTQSLRQLQDAPQRYGIPIPDRELVAAPIASPEGRAYLAAMAAAANYAFANRQVLAHFVRLAFEEILAGKVPDWHLDQLYDVTHNIAKVEDHIVDGVRMRLVVHRKGATRAFPVGRPELPDVYRTTGQPVLVPGSMGTYSYVLAAEPASLELTLGSSCHGAGRRMSRRAATRAVRGESVRAQLKAQGVTVRAKSMRRLAEEAPLAYKDVSLVVESVVGAGIARKVARVRPVAVIKG
ncbi:MAG: RtcB family protein [Anaerolineae bacterium]|nr:RtcB family protein [Anaerolineae bacterium]